MVKNELIERVAVAVNHDAVQPFRHKTLEDWMREMGAHRPASFRLVVSKALQKGAAVSSPLYLFFVEDGKPCLEPVSRQEFDELEDAVNARHGRGECWRALGSVICHEEHDWPIMEHCFTDEDGNPIFEC